MSKEQIKEQIKELESCDSYVWDWESSAGYRGGIRPLDYLEIYLILSEGGKLKSSFDSALHGKVAVIVNALNSKEKISEI